MDNSQTVDESLAKSLVRKQRLKVILDQAHNLEQSLECQQAGTALNVINSLINESDKIINEGAPEDRVQYTTEVVVDSHILQTCNELIGKVIKQNTEFSDQMYQNAINSIVNKGVNPNWDVIADEVFHASATVHIKSTMLGAVELQLKQPIVKERQQRSRKVLTSEKRPETVGQLKRQDTGAEKMNILHKQLAEIFKSNNRRGIPFYKLVVDPDNFMNTVENAFQLAFLARDGIVGIDIGNDGHPKVRLVQSAENKIEMDTSQWICSLDEEKCAQMAKLYKIKGPMLKIELQEVDEEEMDYEEEYCDIESD